MALTDENNGGVGTTMLVQPTGMGGYGNNGFGFDGNGSWWLILFILLMFNGGWGGFGGFGGGNLASDAAVMYPWMNQSNQINGGFRDQMLNSSINGLQNAITSGFGDTALGIAGINQNICQTGNGIVNAMNAGFAGNAAAITGAQNALAQQMYTNQISDLERSFAAQTANTQEMTSLQSQLAQCCCDNRLAVAQTQALVQSENCADRQALSDGIRDIISATTAQNQRILDQLCQDKIDAKNDTIAQLRQELIFARGQASQDVQTAAIQAGQRALANEVEQYVAPKAMPAYIVQNPNCCAQNYGCGCGA